MGIKNLKFLFFYRKLQENERRSDRNRSPGRPSTNQERHQGRKNDQPVLRMVVIGQQSINHRELSSSANQKELFEMTSDCR